MLRTVSLFVIMLTSIRAFSHFGVRAVARGGNASRLMSSQTSLEDMPM